MWEALSLAPEMDDGEADPMNRWTERVVQEALADGGPGAEALFPFGSKVFAFQRWAMRAMGAKPSPLGVLIHPDYGLWFALRAAIIPASVEKPIQRVDELIHPCDACVGKPCLNTCPVTAFSHSGYDVPLCHSYLDERRGSQTDSTGPDCMNGGCTARNACPVGLENRYPDAQLQFHMRAFHRDK
ncbi:MAG: ferredoxin [Rhizobiaceae bacterium]